MRICFLCRGTMKAEIPKRSWLYWRETFRPDFVSWFEGHLIGEPLDEAAASAYHANDMLQNLVR